MRKTICVALLFLAGAAFTAGDDAQGVGGSAFHKNDITYSTSVATPHVKWAPRVPGGPIRGFFIPSVQYGRDMVELMQRLDLAPTTVSIDRNWDINCWGIGDYYGHETRGDRDDFRIVYGYVEKDLTGPASFDVLVIPGLNGWSRMTRASRDAILRRVRDGAGLVLIHPFVGDVKNHPFLGDEREGDGRIWEISPLVGCPDDTVNERGYPDINKAALVRGKWEVARPHFITAGLPMDLLPEGNVGGAYYRYQAKGDVLIKSGDDPIVAVSAYGKGRVVAFAYMEEGFIPSGADPLGSVEEEGFSAAGDPSVFGIYWNYWEYYYSLVAKAVVWAAGRDGGVGLKTAAAGPDEAATVRLTLSCASPRRVELEVAAHSEFGPKFGTIRTASDLRAGDNDVSVPAAALRPRGGWPGGKNIFDIIVRDPDKGETLNWGAATFDVPRRATLTVARPATDVYRDGDILSAVVRATGDVTGLRMRFNVHDDLERLLSSQTVPARQERYFYCSLENFLGKTASITAELVDENDRLVDQLRTRPVLVVQATRSPKEYHPLVAFGAAKHFFSSVRMNQIRAAAADTGFTWGGNVNNGLNIPRGAFGVYWYDRGPTTPEEMEKAIADYNATQDFESLQYLTKKELYRRTGDTKFLARSPSFHDREYMKRLRSIVYAVTRGKARYNMDYYFVGDEGSLTSYADPYDFDWGKDALSAFRSWLQGVYGSVEALNREWKSSFKVWGDVLPFTTEQAVKSGNFPPWADHRTFMEASFADAYRKVREAVVAGDPGGHIAVSGTQVTTAYNGCDWYRLDQVIDDFLSYDGGNQWDLHRSFAKPGAMIGFWTGYESRGIPLQNAIWTAAIHNVLHPNIFWMLSYLNPDFTYSRSARDMGETFKTLRYGGVGKLLMESERLQDGIALHYSMPSVHAATITLNHPERGRREIRRDFPANRDGWVRTIKDLGLQFNFVSYDQVARGTLETQRYRVFVMPMSMALSPAEAQRVRDFAAAGGVVIADAAAGVMDDHCAWQSDGLLNDFFGIRTVPSEKRKLSGSSAVETNADGDVSGTRQSPGVSGAVSATADGVSWGLSAEALEGLEAAEEGVAATTGKPLARVGKTDVGIVRQIGTGWAVYLNVLLDRYPELRSRNYGGGAYRKLVDTIFARMNLRPSMPVLGAGGAPLQQVQAVRYRFGDSRVLALVKENVGAEGIAGRDGVTVYNDANLGAVAREEISIRLPEKLFVHNITTGESLGQTDVVRTSITTGGAVVLGLSVAACALQIAAPASGRPGDALRFTLTLSTTGKHVLRCHVFGPDGSFLPVYAKNLLVSGRTGAFVFPSAVNDALGKYRVVATDVVTGASAEASVVLN